VQVGFFLHTPFPSSEIYRTLPYRENLLRGILKADLIGFHTYDYVRHFISSCIRILGLEGTPYGVEEDGCLVRVGAFPIGINPQKFADTLCEEDVIHHVQYLKQR
jgi:trehalose 6-phosphate synthase/phosphatase